MAEENQNTPSPGKAAKFAVLGFAVMNMAVMVGGAYLVYVSTIGYKNPVLSNEELSREIASLRKELTSTDPVIYNMETFNTNLEGLPRQFVRMELAVEMYNQEGFAELVTRSTESRDAIMRILNSKRFHEMESLQGKLQLKNQIINELNQSLSSGVVKNVYFTRFQVQ